MSDSESEPASRKKKRKQSEKEKKKKSDKNKRKRRKQDKTQANDAVDMAIEQEESNKDKEEKDEKDDIPPLPNVPDTNPDSSLVPLTALNPLPLLNVTSAMLIPSPPNVADLSLSGYSKQEQGRRSDASPSPSIFSFESETPAHVRFWRKYVAKIGVETSLDRIQVLCERIPWPSCRELTETGSHWELEARPGRLQTPRGKRVHIPSRGVHVIDEAYAVKNRLCFVPNISLRAFNNIKAMWQAEVTENKYAINILTGKMEECKHIQGHEVVRDYGQDIRRIDDMIAKDYYWQQKRSCCRDIEISLRSLEKIPSVDIRVSASFEKRLKDKEIDLKPSELESKWNVKRVKHWDKFIFGCFCIDMASTILSERTRSPITGECLGETTKKDPIRTIEVELIYSQEQFVQVLEHKQTIVSYLDHFSRGIAARVAYEDGPMSLLDDVVALP